MIVHYDHCHFFLGKSDVVDWARCSINNSTNIQLTADFPLLIARFSSLLIPQPIPPIVFSDCPFVVVSTDFKRQTGLPSIYGIAISQNRLFCYLTFQNMDKIEMAVTG